MACECPICCCTTAVHDRLEITKKEVLDYLELSLDCVGQLTADANIGDAVLQFDEVICFEHGQCLIIANQEFEVTGIDYANNTVTVEPPLPLSLSECTPIFSSIEFDAIECLIDAAKEEADRCMSNPFVDGNCNPLPIPKRIKLLILQQVSRWYQRRSLNVSAESKTGLGSITYSSDNEFEEALCKWTNFAVLEPMCSSGRGVSTGKCVGW